MTQNASGPGTLTLAPLTDAEAALAGELRRDVEALAGQIGVRNVWRYEALAAAAHYVEGRLAGGMYKVHHQRYEVPPEGRSVANMEVVSPGQSKAQEIVVIGAHYDSKAGPGAKLGVIHGVGHGVTEDGGNSGGAGVPPAVLGAERDPRPSSQPSPSPPDCGRGGTPGGPPGGTPGANDNASGVAALLALARAFAGRRHARTLRFVAFVNEEPPFFQTPHMGSSVYAKRCRERKDQIIGVLALDTLGYYTDRPRTQRYPFPYRFFHPSTGDFVAFISNLSSRRLLKRVAASFQAHSRFPLRAVAVPAVIPRIGWSDDWSFWRSGYPALTVTDTAYLRYPHYHTPQDTPEKLDYPRMARVVAGLEQVVAELAEAE